MLNWQLSIFLIFWTVYAYNYYSSIVETFSDWMCFRLCSSPMQVAFTRNETGIWWRPLPETVTCSISISPVPPSPIPVQSIKLLDQPPLTYTRFSENTVLVSFGLSWDAPMESYGEISEYSVYIGSVPLQPDEEPQLNSFQRAVVRFVVWCRIFKFLC